MRKLFNGDNERDEENGTISIIQKKTGARAIIPLVLLAEEIINLNFEQLNKLYAETKTEPEISEKKITHIKYVDEYKLSEDRSKLYAGLGEEIIKNNQYAVVTMAGGQGTRLGHK